MASTELPPQPHDIMPIQRGGLCGGARRCDGPAVGVKRLLKCTTAEAGRNYFFRGGDSEHTFEAGGLCIKPWRSRSEEDVLVDRVARGQKPVASIVVQRARGQDRILQRVREGLRGLSYVYGANEWGMRVLAVTAVPRATLSMLLAVRSARERRLVAHLTARHAGALRRLRVSDYMVAGGFDMSATHAHSTVNVLESALLYGYPLDFAATHADVRFSRKHCA